MDVQMGGAGDDGGDLPPDAAHIAKVLQQAAAVGMHMEHHPELGFVMNPRPMRKLPGDIVVVDVSEGSTDGDGDGDGDGVGDGDGPGLAGLRVVDAGRAGFPFPPPPPAAAVVWPPYAHIHDAHTDVETGKCLVQNS